MACETIGDNCPRPGDTDNILLRKILLALTSGAGVAGGNGIVETPGGVVNFAQGGPYTPGAIPFATSPTTMGFDPPNLFWDDINNRLGLGINVPDGPLHLAASLANASTLIIEDTSNTAVGPGIRLRHARGTLAARLDVNNGDLIGLIAGRAYSGGGFITGAEIDFMVDGTFVSGQRPPSRIDFYTNVAGGAQLVRLAILSTGIISISGDLVPSVDNTYNIGSALLQVKTVFTPQIQFPATQVLSADPNNLDDYEEGNWTPADGSGAGLALTVVAADNAHTKIGRKVTVVFKVIYPVTADANPAAIIGMAFAYGASGAGAGGFVTFSNAAAVVFTIQGSGIGNAGFFFRKFPGGAFVTNVELSGATISGVLTYFV